MKKKTIQDLVGSEIIKFLRVHDYWQIFFDTTIINVYNSPRLLDSDGNSMQIDEIEQAGLVGLKIMNVIDESGEYIMLILNDRRKLILSTAKDNAKCPEAIELQFSSGEWIVF